MKKNVLKLRYENIWIKMSHATSQTSVYISNKITLFIRILSILRVHSNGIIWDKVKSQVMNSGLQDRKIFLSLKWTWTLYLRITTTKILLHRSSSPFSSFFLLLTSISKRKRRETPGGQPRAESSGRLFVTRTMRKGVIYGRPDEIRWPGDGLEQTWI